MLLPDVSSFFIYIIGQFRDDKKQCGRGVGSGSSSQDSNTGCPERNSTICQHAVYKAIGANTSQIFMINNRCSLKNCFLHTVSVLSLQSLYIKRIIFTSNTYLYVTFLVSSHVIGRKNTVFFYFYCVVLLQLSQSAKLHLKSTLNTICNDLSTKSIRSCNTF